MFHNAGYEILSIDNAVVIVDELIRASQVSYEFGLALKLPSEIVNRIKEQYADPLQRLLHTVEEFLKQKQPLPTWRAITEALRMPSVNRPKLAKAIEKKFCSVGTTQSSKSEHNMCFLLIIA